MATLCEMHVNSDPVSKVNNRRCTWAMTVKRTPVLPCPPRTTLFQHRGSSAGGQAQRLKRDPAKLGASVSPNAVSLDLRQGCVACLNQHRMGRRLSSLFTQKSFFSRPSIPRPSPLQQPNLLQITLRSSLEPWRLSRKPRAPLRGT